MTTLKYTILLKFAYKKQLNNYSLRNIQLYFKKKCLKEQKAVSELPLPHVSFSPKHIDVCTRVYTHIYIRAHYNDIELLYTYIEIYS